MAESSHRQFAEEIRAFVAENWQEPDPDLARWRDALITRCWHLPHWPQENGGPGWSPTQQFIWAKCLAQAGAPDLQTDGTLIVGPLLYQGMKGVNEQPLATAWLDELRGGVDQWQVLVREPDWDFTATGLTTVIDSSGSISGTKLIRPGAETKYLCCLARKAGAAVWALFEAEENEVSGGCLVLDGAAVELEISAEDDVARLVRLIPEHQLYRSFDIQSQLQALRRYWDTMEFDEDEVSELLRSHAELGVAAEALAAMEERYVHALDAGLELPFPREVLNARSREVLIELGDLQVRSFGYYALPYPDPLLTHNEGPVGPGTEGDIGVGMDTDVRRTLGRLTGELYEDAFSESFVLHDTIAKDLEL